MIAFGYWIWSHTEFFFQMTAHLLESIHQTFKFFRLSLWSIKKFDFSAERPKMFRSVSSNNNFLCFPTFRCYSSNSSTIFTLNWWNEQKNSVEIFFESNFGRKSFRMVASVIRNTLWGIKNSWKHLTIAKSTTCTQFAPSSNGVRKHKKEPVVSGWQLC